MRFLKYNDIIAMELYGYIKQRYDTFLKRKTITSVQNNPIL